MSSQGGKLCSEKDKERNVFVSVMGDTRLEGKQVEPEKWEKAVRCTK